MLRRLKDLENHPIDATDGPIGHVKDFYFDDDAWTIRYFVVDTGSWLSSRQVLISPIGVHRPDWQARALPVFITKEQVRNSPDIDTDQPVSRQNESQVLGYYGYPGYWMGTGLWGEGMYPYAMDPGYGGPGVDRIDRAEREREAEACLRAERERHRHDDPHLRSCKAVTGYHLHATDGEIGHVSGFLVDDETWAIRYLIVDTGTWWFGHQVLIAPPWITGVHWSEQTVSVELSRESVRSAPVYDAGAVWGVDDDVRLYRHYGRSAAWTGATLLAESPH